MKFKRIAIANRGEVAVRIMRACQELGIETVLLHSDVDINSRAYRMANHRVCIGGASPAESYLNIKSNVLGALSKSCEALHPGFGFLSENAEFAQACEQSGIKFIGPSAHTIRTLGDKVNCKMLAKQVGIPLVPGYDGDDQSVERLIHFANQIGFPVIVKAAAGGGGRGMKLIESSADAREKIESAQRESLSAFGSSKVFLEKYLNKAKHIEFQIFGDSVGSVRHLFERDCSVQRRHQKIIEEAPGPLMTDELRKKMGDSAVAIAKAAQYQNAGTVEFMVQDGEFYLLEVNTRLQVEHPVTEMILGMDLVKAQILTTMGEFVFTADQNIQARGHSIECRVYAENSYQGGIPSTGLLGHIEFPDGPGRRFEYGFDSGDTITAHYDPMMAKIIVWDETRVRAVEKMIQTLKQTVVFGVHTNIPYLVQILSHPDFISGKMNTQFIDQYFTDPIKALSLTENEEQMIMQITNQLKSPSFSKVDINQFQNSILDPFDISWRMW